MGNQNSSKQKQLQVGFIPTKVIPYQDFPFARITPNEKDTTTPITVLPKEAFISVALKLSEKDLLSLSRCCKKLQERLNDSVFWVQLAKERKHVNFERYEKFNHISGKHWYYQQCKLDVIAEASSKPIENASVRVFVAGCPKVGRTKLGEALVGLPFNKVEESEITTRIYQGTFKYCGSEWTINVEERHSSEKLMMFQSLFSPEWILLVYSVADRASFEELNNFFNEAKTRCKSGVTKMILVSTFNDLPKEQHQVTSKEGFTWAEEHGISFVQVSSSSGQGVRFLRRCLLPPMPTQKLNKKAKKRNTAPV